MEIGKTIYKLREQSSLSREGFAALFNVSQQAVQKWESGAAMPTVANLVAIAKHFNISVDSLLLEEDGCSFDALRLVHEITPDFCAMDSVEAYYKMLGTEYEQCFEEGLDVEPYRDLFSAVEKMPDSAAKEKISDVLFGIVSNVGMRADYPFREPSDLDGIRAERDGYFQEGAVPTDMRGKIAGAWYGRICGCLLGKPVEGLRTEALIPLLEMTGNYPMHRYILKSDITDEICARFDSGFRTRCWADNISCAPVDDDTNYTVLAQLMIDRCGREFTPENVCNMWVASQSRNAYCTAERIAFRNIVNGYRPPNTAKYKNPCREWIGAQIRGDYYGYINPGNPELAAEMAWRDASISHIKNGIYGEMFVAAMLSCAACSDDMTGVIRGGLGQIPAGSRLYKAITGVIEKFEKGVSAEDCMADIHAEYDEHTAHGWCHTISNAMIVAAALLYGGGDYGRSVCLAVQTGFDTDCNGATVGSVIGMMKGVKAIGAEWTDPIKGVQDTSIFGVGKVGIDTLVEKTLKHAGF
ncbi:MAG: ADP-ribosylglycohydrolase family protein [Clostridiales bacterium]|nr:ADP-ribosylglycohydrolase family protein [Clostridiales bacterium]